MTRPILIASAFALAAPAFAQMTTNDDVYDPTTTGAVVQDHTGHGMAPPQTPTTQVDDASGMTMANWNFSGDWGEIGTPNWGVGAMTTAQAQTSAGYTGMGGPIDVATQWSTISSGGSDLTPLEFGVWLLEANGKDVEARVDSTLRSRASNLPAIQVLNVTAGALAEADTNGDWRVSQAELTAFAGG